MYKIPVTKESSLQVSVLVAGFSAMVVQVIFVRAFMNILHSNELVLGVILSNWMLLTGIGARIGSNRFFSPRAVSGFHIAIGLLPSIGVFAIYLAKAQFFPPGYVPGLAQSWLFSFLLMAPFCAVSGAQFTIFAKTYRDYYFNDRTASIYGVEAIGALLGSLLFVFLLIKLFDVPEILILLTSANFAAALLFSVKFGNNKKTKHIIISGLLLWLVLHFVFNWYAVGKAANFRGQTILEDRESPFGNLVITKSAGQLNFIENGVSLFSNEDIQHVEEFVHFAMLQHKDPKNVLVVSGNIKAILPEVFKYPVRRLDFVEVNPELLRGFDKYFTLPHDDRLHVHRDDPAGFIKNSKSNFDVILLHIPLPVNIQFNRYYTLEFFESIKKRMNPDAVLAFSLAGNSNYLSDEMLETYSVIHRTLSEVFKNVIIFPGQVNYFLVSDGELAFDISQKAEIREIESLYVNSFYLDDDLLEQRGREILELINEDAAVNKDFKPVAFFTMIGNWLSWYQIKISWIIFGILALFILVFLLLHAAQYAIFFAGFTASSIEIMALLSFQVLFGYVYQMLAILIAAFMGGLALGSHVNQGGRGNGMISALIKNQLFVGLSALLIPALILVRPLLAGFDFIIGAGLFAIVIVSGIFTGITFKVTTKLTGGTTAEKASRSYGADLAGSAGGALITAIVLIPITGMMATGCILFVANMLVILMIGVSGKLRK